MQRSTGTQKSRSKRRDPFPPHRSKKTSHERAPSPPPPAPTTPQKHNPSRPAPTQKPQSAMPATANTSCSNSSAAPSPSTLLRAQGNALYKQVLEGGFCATIQRGKLARALRLYNEALHASLTVDEKTSCYKNLGMLQWLFCKVELNEKLVQARDGCKVHLCLSANDLSVCKFYILDAVKSFSQARELGVKAKSHAWLDHLQNVIDGIVEWASEQTSLLSVPYSPLLQYVSQAFETAALPSTSRLLAYRSYADALFKEALTKRLPDESMDYKGCHSLLQICCVPLRKAASCSVADHEEGSRLLLDVKDLQVSVNVHLCICEAMQAINLGDKCLSEALMDDEEMDLERVKDSLDYYRQASLATRELDMESEAVAMSRIGKVYSEVLKLPDVAHKYHFQALRLALTVMSPNIARADWYQYCSDKVKAHQEKVAAEEKEKHDKDRAPAMRRMKEKLAALYKAADKGSEALLKHVYEVHPHPELRRNVVPLVGSKEKVKASIKKALLHYHPDSNARYGEDWRVLCEEICKHLNDKYGSFCLMG